MVKWIWQQGWRVDQNFFDFVFFYEERPTLTICACRVVLTFLLSPLQRSCHWIYSLVFFFFSFAFFFVRVLFFIRIHYHNRLTTWAFRSALNLCWPMMPPNIFPGVRLFAWIVFKSYVILLRCYRRDLPYFSNRLTCFLLNRNKYQIWAMEKNIYPIHFTKNHVQNIELRNINVISVEWTLVWRLNTLWW